MLFEKIDTKFENNRLVVSFLNNKQILEKLDFHDNISFLNFFNKIELNAKNSGMELFFENGFEFQKIVYSEILKESQQNHTFKIKNKEFECWFYCLVEMQEFPEVKFLGSWRFLCSPVEMSRKEWVISHNLELHNCCTRNYIYYLDKKLQNLDSEFSPKVQFVGSGKDLESFCCFPKEFVEIKKSFSLGVLSNLTDNQPSIEKLQFFVKPAWNLVNNKMINLPFIYYSDTVKTKEQVLDTQFLNLLKNLNDQDALNFNCKDLYSDLCFSEDSFRRFLVDCIFNIFQTEKIVFTENKTTKQKITILACEFLVK